jgi:pyruvate dehydrogenase E1 component
MSNKPDIDPQETQEWLDALEAVLENEGVERAHFLLESLIDKARRSGAYLPFSANTAYLNTIPITQQEKFPGDRAMERRIRSFVRWNAMAMVVQANRLSTELGGHISTFASSATLVDMGYNHFFKARSKDHGGDLVFFQGHAAPGIYARAYLEGRSPRSSSTTSARRWTGQRPLLLSPPLADAGLLAIPDRLSWGSVPSWPFTRRASCAICITGAW